MNALNKASKSPQICIQFGMTPFRKMITKVINIIYSMKIAYIGPIGDPVPIALLAKVAPKVFIRLPRQPRQKYLNSKNPGFIAKYMMLTIKQALE